jgi:UDP-N-acetylmuramate dehydrogenase
MQIRENFPLSDYLWYKIGGKAKYFLEITSLNDVPRALDFLHTHTVNRIFVCGLGSNLIFTDDDFDGAVISITKPQERKPLRITEDGVLEVFAGDTLDTAIEFAFEHNLTGLEWAGGLPGTVGAGVRGNVGAFGGEIKDTLLSAEVIEYTTENPEPKILTNEELHFVYRGSFVKEHKKMLVTSATFILRRADAEELATAREIYERNKQHRRDRHPLEYPNCGSVFKNIRPKDQIERVLALYPDLAENVEKKWYGKVAAASLIERLGFKGYRIGNAQVSEKHALFIVNLGGAKAADVKQIIHDIQEKFQETFDFQLEVEVEIVE